MNEHELVSINRPTALPTKSRRWRVVPSRHETARTVTLEEERVHICIPDSAPRRRCHTLMWKSSGLLAGTQTLRGSGLSWRVFLCRSRRCRARRNVVGFAVATAVPMSSFGGSFPQAKPLIAGRRWLRFLGALSGMPTMMGSSSRVVVLAVPCRLGATRQRRLLVGSAVGVLMLTSSCSFTLTVGVVSGSSTFLSCRGCRCFRSGAFLRLT